MYAVTVIRVLLLSASAEDHPIMRTSGAALITFAYFKYRFNEYCMYCQYHFQLLRNITLPAIRGIKDRSLKSSVNLQGSTEYQGQ